MTNPNPLPYSMDPEPPLGMSAMKRFLLGLACGAAVSVVAWVLGWKQFVSTGSGHALLVVPGMKFSIGLALVFPPRWRAFGIGVLVSIALGLLIFMGACMVNFDWTKMH